MTDKTSPDDTTPPAGASHRRPVERWTLAVRWTAAIVFVVFGTGKFVNPASELASFRAYALPAAGTFVYAIGVLEIAGGLLLAMRSWWR